MQSGGVGRPRQLAVVLTGVWGSVVCRNSCACTRAAQGYDQIVPHMAPARTSVTAGVVADPKALFENGACRLRRTGS